MGHANKLRQQAALTTKVSTGIRENEMLSEEKIEMRSLTSECHGLQIEHKMWKRERLGARCLDLDVL